MRFCGGNILCLRRIIFKFSNQNDPLFSSCNSFSIFVDKFNKSVVRKELYDTPLKQFVRWKAPKFSKLKGTMGVRRCRVKGIMIDDGEWVSAGTMLVRQLSPFYFPGLNVGMARNRNLFALEHGILYITTEKCNPDWESKLVQTFYGQYEKKNVPLYRTYFHIIPKNMPQKFNLIDQI